ncbi:MAG: hypothetical protein H7831_11320 [Magnetococcus sp. WYHC-3]
MRGMGALALVLALLFWPLVLFGGYLTLLSALLAASADARGSVFALFAILANILNIVVFSPSMMTNARVAWQTGAWEYPAIVAGLLLVQLLAWWVLWARNRRRRLVREWMSLSGFH